MAGVVNLSYDASAAVTPSDAVNDSKGPFGALFVVAAGTLKYLDAAGNVITIPGTLPIGTLVPVKVVRVFNTGTTATVLGLIAVA